MAGVNSKGVSLVWLDAEVDAAEDNRKLQEKLQQIISRFRTFDDPKACRKYITSLTSYDQLILIVSGAFGRQLVPDIHSLVQVSAIHVYCMNEEANKQWSNQYCKVRSVVVRAKDLVAQIAAGVKPSAKLEDPLVIGFAIDPGETTVGISGHFIHSLLLIDALTRMESNETDQQSLIDLCKEKYRNDTKELSRINEFELDYKPEKALWWYTRESFVYNMLNKALRDQNIDVLFLFRFVIRDIDRQLEKRQHKTAVTVYRGQVMSKKELSKLAQSVSELISVNSFLSTSTKKDKAVEFMNRPSVSPTDSRVLFEIKAVPHPGASKHFADISAESDMEEELEVLFMAGCIFKLVSVDQDRSSQTWKIRMNLCEDNQHDLKDLYEHMKNGYGGGDAEVNLRSLGEILRKMGKFEQAEKMFRRAFVETPRNDHGLFALHYSMGQLFFDTGKYDDSLVHFKQALKLKEKTDPLDYVHIAALYTWIGNVYLEKDNVSEAQRFYNGGIQLFKQNSDDNHPDLAYLYNSLALIYDKEEKFADALKYYERSLDIRRRKLVVDHPEIASCLNNIGCAYLNLEDYDRAERNHQEALRIREKALPSGHPDLAMSHANLGQLYEARRQWREASNYYEKARSIYKQSFSATHSYVVRIEQDIQRLSLKPK